MAILGIGLGYVLAKGRFRGRGLIEAVGSLPMGLPPTVTGYYLLTLLGSPGPVRSLSVALLGHPLIFTFDGIVIAAAVEAFPYTLRSARAAIAGVDVRLEQAARTMGLSRWRIALTVTLPLARRGIIAGLAMSFGRALGDYGATVAVAGGFAGTTTMPIALAGAVFDGSPGLAQRLAVLQVGTSLTILLLVSRMGKTRAW